MNKKNIKKDYLEKIKLIQTHNFYYYNKDKPIISDQEFDLLKKYIINLENTYKFL